MVAARTLAASGSGTVGYVAPEQAMGKPSLRSDVFSAGLVIWRMLSGKLPKWPYHLPLPGTEKVKSIHPDLPPRMADLFERSERVTRVENDLAALENLIRGEVPA